MCVCVCGRCFGLLYKPPAWSVRDAQVSHGPTRASVCVCVACLERGDGARAEKFAPPRGPEGEQTASEREKDTGLAAGVDEVCGVERAQSRENENKKKSQKHSESRGTKATDLAARVDEVCGVKKLLATVALVTAGVVVAAQRAGSLNVPVRKESVCVYIYI